MLAAVLPASGGGGAQTVAEPAEAVSRTPGGAPWTGDNRTPSISANGRVVEFDADPEVDTVSIRHRVDNTTAFVPFSPSVNGSISENGCVVAYTNDEPLIGAAGLTYQIRAYDRCVPVDMSVGTSFSTPGFGAPQPKPNQDGSVIVWASSNGLERAGRSGNSYVQGATVTFPGLVLGRRVAVSDSGGLVAFETSTNTIYLTDLGSPGSLEAISVGDSGEPIGNSTDPSISGDGTLVTYTFQFSDSLFGVLLRDRVNGANRGVAVPARSGEISRDGRYVTYRQIQGEVGEIYVARSTGSQPFSSFVVDLVSYRDGDVTSGTGGSAFDPDISEHGRWVTFDSFAGSLLVPGAGFDSGTHVFVRQRRPVLTVAATDFGETATPVDRDVAVTNVGPSGWRITSFDISGPFSVVSDTCAAVLHPDQSCTVRVRFLPPGEGVSVGQLFVRDDSYPGVPLVASGSLTGRAPGVVTTTTRPPVVTTTLPVRLGLTVTPDPVVFPPTVVGASGGTRTATVTNVGAASVSVVSVDVVGVDVADFSVATDGCTGTSLAPAASCEVVVGFVPTAGGDRVATLDVIGSGGTGGAVILRGTGRFDAALSVLPEVAAGGQVVNVRGEGYPPSSPVGVVVGAAASVSVTTDAAGNFSAFWVVLAGTPQGPVVVDDVAVVGLYDAEPVEFLVVPSPMRPQGVATNPALRAHVSR